MYAGRKGGWELTNVEVVGVADVHTSDADAAKVLDGLDALVDDLAGVGLEAYCELDGVEPTLGVLAVRKLVSDLPTRLRRHHSPSNTFERHIRTATIADLLQMLHKSLASLEL